MNSKEFNMFMGTRCVHAEGPNVPLGNGNHTRGTREPTPSLSAIGPDQPGRVASDHQLPYLLSPLPTQDLAAHQTRSPDQVHRRCESSERLQPPSDPRRRPSHLSEPSPKPSGGGRALLQLVLIGALPVATKAAWKGRFRATRKGLTKPHDPQLTVPLGASVSSPVKWRGAD